MCEKFRILRFFRSFCWSLKICILSNIQQRCIANFHIKGIINMIWTSLDLQSSDNIFNYGIFHGPKMSLSNMNGWLKSLLTSVFRQSTYYRKYKTFFVILFFRKILKKGRCWVEIHTKRVWKRIMVHVMDYVLV